MNVSSIGSQIRFKQNSTQNRVQTANANQTAAGAKPEALKIDMLKIVTGVYTNDQIKQINETRLLPVGTKLGNNSTPRSVGGYDIRPLLPGDSKEQRYLPDGFTLKRAFNGNVIAYKTQPS